MNPGRVFLGAALLAAVGSASWPLAVSHSVERFENGNTLIADGGSPQRRHGVAVEVDSLGRLVWAYVRNDVPWLHTARRTAEGNTLLSATDKDRVLEVDALGDSVWCFSDGLDYPNEAYRLPGGNTLITDRDHSRVIEVDATGVVVWSYTDLFHPHNGNRLPNGNTLICDSNSNKVVEVDSAGNVMWQKGGLRWPRCAQRLANGNTLITDSQNHRVIEVDSLGLVVWSHRDSLNLPYMAVRFENGHTLISDSRLSGGSRVLEVDSAGTVVWRYPRTVDVLVDTLRVFNPASGCSLYVHIHRPECASATNRVPGVVLVPGGNGWGCQYDTSGLADNIADDGFAVLHFDPDGRGLSDSFPENYCGYVHQDGMYRCLQVLAGQEYVDTSKLGVFSQSYGITMATGMLARHADSVPVAFLLDFEGPADRNQTCQDSGGHVPVPPDSESFWVEREAARFIRQVPAAYLRVQTAEDHNARIIDNRHCIALVDSATAMVHGGSGISPWTRVNDSVMNQPNLIYTVGDPPEWIPEQQEPHIGLRYLLYLHELAEMDVPVGTRQEAAVRLAGGLRAVMNPVPGHQPVRVRGSDPHGTVRVWNSCGQLVAECRADDRQADATQYTYTWDRRLTRGGRAVPGCYWFGSVGTGPSVKLVLVR